MVKMTKWFNRQNEQFALIYSMLSIDEVKRRNLIKILERIDIPQIRVAERLNTAPEYLNNVIKGRRNLSDDMVDRLCKEFGLKRYEFYLEDDTPLPATELERQALYMAREAEKECISDVAKDVIEYVTHRIEIKKQKGESDCQGDALRHKTGSG